METPSYYAILPANVRYDKALPPMARILFAEITALSNRDGFCSASNRYFAELYEVDESTVTKWIGALRDRQHITVLITRNETKQIIGRQIFPAEALPAKMRVPSPQKDQDPPRKNAGTPPRKNAVVNTTSINTTSINRETAPAKSLDWKEVAELMLQHSQSAGQSDWEFMKAATGYKGDGKAVFSGWAAKAGSWELINWKDNFRRLQTWMRNEARADLKSPQPDPPKRRATSSPQPERERMTPEQAMALREKYAVK